MKQKIFSILAVVAMLSLGSCRRDKSVPVDGLSLNETTVFMNLGDTLKIQASISPSNATEKGVTWQSSNPAVASVSGGTLIALAEGLSTITATTVDGGKKAGCKVMVKTQTIVAPTGITLDKKMDTLAIGETVQLLATVLPNNATNKRVRYASTEPGIATVSDNGLVTAIKPGVVYIQAATPNGRDAQCRILVSTPQNVYVTLNQVTAGIAVGETKELVATLHNASGQSVSWHSSNPAIAKVTEGAVQAVAQGKVDIIASTEGGSQATCAVEVYTIGDNGCNSATPGFGESLGTVMFRTPTIWTVGNQEWSDVVLASNCEKDSYYGGVDDHDNTPFNFYADCRSTNFHFTDRTYGHLFSWCAVNRFADQICPNDWRVPTSEDYLLLAKGITGYDFAFKEEGRNASWASKFVRDWGITYDGYCTEKYPLMQGTFAAYWASDESNPKYAYMSNYTVAGVYAPLLDLWKYMGVTVRCVRNK